MENYVREHSFGSFVRSTISIYVRGVWGFFLTYTLPMLPVYALQQEAAARQRMGLSALAFLAQFLVGFFACGVSVLQVADICLGNRPSPLRSYSRVLGTVAWKLLVTNILLVLAIWGGTLLLILPGLLVAMWYGFAPIVVALEGLSGRAALKRSKALSKGCFWRVTGFFVVVLLGMSLLFIGGNALLDWPSFRPASFWVSRLVLAVIQTGVAAPLWYISLVVLYYDLRARKEAYDSKLLAEELRH
jgi:hypothetical protein